MGWKSCFKPVCRMLVALSCVAALSCLWAQTASSQSSDANKSWTATTESQVSADQNPTRKTETHKQSGNRTVDTQSVERLGPDGHFEPFFDTETETVRVNATTVRTVVRSFARDGNGQRTLTQVTEEARESLPSGGEKVVRTVSTPDGDGHLPVVRREVTDTRKTGSNAQESKTTVFSSDGSGGLAPSMQIRERQTRTGDHSTEVQKTTMLPDGGGNWQVHELKENTITENGKDRTTDERVSRPEYDGGKLSVSSHTIAKESETSPGEKHASVETYSTDIPGSAPDGKLHVSQRVTTVSRPHSNGRQTTEQQVDRPNFGDPNAGLQVTTIEIVGTDNSGKQQTRTIEARDGSGQMKVVSVDTRKSSQTQAPQAVPTPQDKPK